MARAAVTAEGARDEVECRASCRVRVRVRTGFGYGCKLKFAPTLPLLLPLTLTQNDPYPHTCTSTPILTPLIVNPPLPLGPTQLPNPQASSGAHGAATAEAALRKAEAKVHQLYPYPGA